MLSELPQVADIVRSVFHYSASPLVLRITAFGSEQFHGELWPNNATRLSRIDWLWSAKRASVWVTGGGRRRVNQENPPMRIYIIGNDGITLCREAPAAVNEGEIAVASNEELHAAPLSGKRLLALWNALPDVEKRRKVGRGGSGDRVAAPYCARGLLRNAEEEARAQSCFGPRGARPGLSHRRAGERMKPAIHDASARQHSGGPSPVAGRGGNRNERARKPGLRETEDEIAGLLDRSTPDLRLAWREFHRAGPPLGLSRDLLIRAVAYELQQRAHGGPGLALRRRLQSLAGASEKGTLAVDPGLVLKAGTTLVRQWRGHTHTVLVHRDGFEHEGQRYRSLTAIAERITEAHWSGPRFFGLTKRAPASSPASAGQ